MSQEQPATPDSTTPARDDGGISAAAQALANKRWAKQQESAPVEEEATNPAAEPESPVAPEEEQPAEELDSEPQEGHEEGEEEAGEEPEADESVEEDSEVDEPEEQPSAPLNLDELDDDVTVTIDGREVPVSEIREQRMLQADYTRKTQALAEQRDLIKEREKLNAAYLGQQEAIFKQRLSELQNMNWQELAKDPQAFQQKQTEAQALQLQYGQFQQQQKAWLQQIQQFEEQAQAAQAQAAQKELKNRIKGWNNGLYYSLVDYAEKTGFNREEVLKYVDPNVFILLQKAKAYDEAQKASTKKRVKPAPKRTPKASQPQPPSRKVAQDQAKVLEKAKSSGRIEDAIDALRAKRAMR